MVSNGLVHENEMAMVQFGPIQMTTEAKVHKCRPKKENVCVCMCALSSKSKQHPLETYKINIFLELGKNLRHVVPT